MTATQPETPVVVTATPADAEPARAELSARPDGAVVVTLTGTRCAAAVLSRALHAALDETPSGVLVDLGLLDPELARPVLRCAEQRAHSQGATLQVLPHP